MNIGLIVYSHTGHTLSVAMKLKDILSTNGHVVTLEQLQTVVPLLMSATTAELKTIPGIDRFDALVLGTPVRGGTPSPPMMCFLNHISSFEGKKVALLVTGFFPAKWGRNQTISQLETICEAKGAIICCTGSVGWWSMGRNHHIAQVIDRLSTPFL
jgi:flavodoxin I